MLNLAQTLTITDLRRRAWVLANGSIDAINGLNQIIYEEAPSPPPVLDNQSEDTANVSLQYIQDGLDLYLGYQDEINKKCVYLDSLIEKNRECMAAITEISGA